MTGSSIHVELRSPVGDETLPHAAARLGWREPLRRAELESIARWASARGAPSIRLHGAAVAQLDEIIETVPVAILDIDAARIATTPRSAPSVLELILHGLPDRIDETLAAFCSARVLRVDARGGSVDVRTLAALPQLRAVSIAAASLKGCAGIEGLRALLMLELVRTKVDDAEALLGNRGIAGLRLAKVERVRSLEPLRGHDRLRWLALESLLHLESLAPIAGLSHLETLAIGRLWQFNVGDAEFVASMRGLRALSLDIGGARKNVEITKRLGLPPAPPFDAGDYDFTTSNESGVQSLPAYLSSVTTVGLAGAPAGENGRV